MDIEKGKTFKYLRETRGVSEKAKENIKNYNRVKRSILDALSEGDMTVDQLTRRLDMQKHELFYYLMTMVKYGLIQTGDIDDMDEYFAYKLKK